MQGFPNHSEPVRNNMSQSHKSLISQLKNGSNGFKTARISHNQTIRSKGSQPSFLYRSEIARNLLNKSTSRLPKSDAFSQPSEQTLKINHQRLQTDIKEAIERAETSNAECLNCDEFKAVMIALNYFSILGH